MLASRVARPSRLERNSLLHDGIPQRIPQRMVLAIKLETSRRLSCARELSYLLVSYLSRHYHAKPRPQPTGDEPKPRTTWKQKNKKTNGKRIRNNIQRESDHGQQPRQSPRRAQTQGR
jgi:hypothetical protein